MRSTALIFLVFSSSAALARPPTGSVTGSFPLPTDVTLPAGVTDDGSSHWISSQLGADGGGANQLIITGTSGTVQRRVAGPVGGVLGDLGFDGANIWAVVSGNELRKVDSQGGTLATVATHDAVGVTWNLTTRELFELRAVASGEVVVRDVSGTVTSTISLGADTTQWRGLAHDGCSLWTSDLATHQLVRLDPTAGTELARYPAPGQRTVGLDYDGQFSILAADQADLRISRVEAGDVLVHGATCAPGFSPPDAGTVDAGARSDGGTRPDSGTAPDAASGPDAGSTTLDAGGGASSDAGAGAADAGAGSSGLKEDPSGICACVSSAQTGTAWGLGLAAVALHRVGRRRRR